MTNNPKRRYSGNDVGYMEKEIWRKMKTLTGVYRCVGCNKTFHEDRALPVTEFDDDMHDRGPVARIELHCPYCNSVCIAPDEEFENEGRLGERAFGPDRDE